MNSLCVFCFLFSAKRACIAKTIVTVQRGERSWKLIINMGEHTIKSSLENSYFYLNIGLDHIFFSLTSSHWYIKIAGLLRSSLSVFLSFSMTPFFMPLSNEEGDQDQSHDSVLISASTSTFPCNNFFDNLKHERTNDCHDQQELSHHGLSYQSKTVEEGSLSFGEVDEKVNERSGKWLFMTKMMSSEKIILKTSRTRRRRNPQELEDQQLNQQNSNNAQTGFIRFCSDCNTTKTPLWRSGPQGPKSLCNACGIRRRKARRAMAAATEMASLINVEDKLNEVGKEKGWDVDHSTVPFKKRCKFNHTEPTQKNVCLENVRVSLSKNSGFMNPPPPQDERDAAILLMSLSCNLVIS